MIPQLRFRKQHRNLSGALSATGTSPTDNSLPTSSPRPSPLETPGMYNPWKPQETLLYTSVLKPVLQANLGAATCPLQAPGTGYFANVLPAVSYCSFSMRVLPPV